MATGKVHQKSNRKLIRVLFIVNSILLVLAYVFFGVLYWQYFVASLLALLFGYLYGPDLDHHVITINETELAVLIYYGLKNIGVPYIISNAIKQIVIYITLLFWSIYSLIPHRHWLSHSYIFGTLLRNIYFITILYGSYFIKTNNYELVYMIYNNMTFSFLLYLCFFFNNVLVDNNYLRLDKI